MQEYAQYTGIVKQVLRYRRLKQAQLEMIHDTLQDKRAALDALLKTEDKASQLKATLMQPEEGPSAADSDSLETRSIEDGFAAITDIPTDVPPEEATNGHESDEYPANASASALRASRDRSKKWSSPRKFLNAVSYTIQGMIDIDPETTRKNQIAKLKDTVTQVCMRVWKCVRIALTQVIYSLKTQQRKQKASLKKCRRAFNTSSACTKSSAHVNSDP